MNDFEWISTPRWKLFNYSMFWYCAAFDTQGP